jgi:mono/diheme cytochrome c family protein
MSASDPNKPVNQNDAEPTADLSSVPIWLVVVFGALIYWCQIFLDGHAGGFSKDVYAPYHDFQEVAAANPQDPEAKMRARGREIFAATCSACHQLSGLGQEGKAPPLVGSRMGAGAERRPNRPNRFEWIDRSDNRQRAGMEPDDGALARQL